MVLPYFLDMYYGNVMFLDMYHCNTLLFFEYIKYNHLVLWYMSKYHNITIVHVQRHGICTFYHSKNVLSHVFLLLCCGRGLLHNDIIHKVTWYYHDFWTCTVVISCFWSFIVAILWYSLTTMVYAKKKNMTFVHFIMVITNLFIFRWCA